MHNERLYLEAGFERLSRLLLETIDRLLSIPDRLRQLVLAAQPIFVDGPQGSTTNVLRFTVVGLIPHHL